ncbi:MAG: flagellar export protein FliJ [bacterium]|nr:flagellar export protein FliJ [bacterium]
MAAFRFRLEKVLRYRRRVVDQRSRQVAAAEMVLAAVDNRIAALRRYLDELPVPDGSGGTIDVRARLELAAWYNRQERALEQLGAERQAAADEVADRRQDLSAAFQDREVLERLRQRKREEWVAEEGRRERLELDEIGQQRSVRTRTAIAATSAQVAS